MLYVGNEKNIKILSKSLEKDSISHAYLFAGPEKVGKRTLAVAFAKSIISGDLLEKGFNEGDSLDLLMISPQIEERKGVRKENPITIEQIRQAQHDLSLYPYSGRKKVLIIDNAHKMNIASQNAFLKILEEPNSTTAIILITHQQHALLPTIVSRCQRVVFSLSSTEEIADSFFKKDLENANKFAAISMGRPGIACEIANDKEVLSVYLDAQKNLSEMLKGDINERFIFAEKAAKDVYATISMLNIWIWLLRTNALRTQDSRRIEVMYAGIEKIQTCIETIRETNSNARLALESMLLKL